jgi:hypothetical protein
MFNFFTTLSSGVFKWTDTLNAKLRQQGRCLSPTNINCLKWEEKCNILRSNPVTAARHFDYRIEQFLQSCAPANSLGKVFHYSYRIEFQKKRFPSCPLCFVG